jgi:hypothetical protein
MIKQMIVVAALLSLSGCGFMPKLTAAKPNFPPPYLDEKTKEMPKCEDLKIVPADVNNLSSIFKIITENYTAYWQCSNKVDGWKDWYNEQKKNYESVK